MPAAFAALLAMPGATLPEHDLGIRRFQTPPLGPSMRLAQSFTMPVGGLQAIEIFPVAVDGPWSGEVRFELYDIYDVGTDYHETLVRSTDVSASQLRTETAHRFAFAPIADSTGHKYRLDFVAPTPAGVALRATRGKGYDGGALYADGRERWADLAFSVDAPVPSVWGLLMRLRETQPLRAYTVIAAMLAFGILVGFVLRALAPVDA